MSAACPQCTGPWIDGRLAMPIVGGLRFGYRLGTTEVTTEVAARMCAGCGHVELRAQQPELIDRAARAAAAGATTGPASRKRLWGGRPPQTTIAEGSKS